MPNLTSLCLVGAMLISLSGFTSAADTGSNQGSGEILLGQTADMSGPIAASTKEATDVALAYFDRANRRGGISGRKIRVLRLDDGYDPKRSLQNAQQLAQDPRVLAITMGRGTANAEAVLKELDQLRIPVIGWSGGSRVMHTPPNRYFFNVRPPYALEMEKVLAQLAAQGSSRTAAIYTDDAFGRDTLSGYEVGLKATQLTGVAVAPIPRGAEPDVKEAVSKVTAARPDSVIGICTPKPCAILGKALRSNGYSGRFLSLSPTSTAAYVKDLGDTARGVIVSQVFPPPTSRSVAASLDFQRLADEYKLSRSYVAMEGYVMAATLFEAIRRAGPAPTREGLVKALETMNPWDLGGFNISFSPQNRTGSKHVDLTIVDSDGRFAR